MIEIDAERALALMREVVEEVGEHHVDDACQYVVDDQPGCLIGRALFRAGVSIESLRRMEGRAVRSGDHLAYTPADIRTNFAVTPRAEDVFTAAQNCQDDAEPWGVALREARAELERLYYDDWRRL